uniref:NADH-ubiquinone oxidoreductase chain 2 n=1 Tax=Curculionoidea sp. 11 KM-2017 TaxID=2219394 RepID=A0A346RJY6_9CUCU|nr:NADH dehydrogenase subunit 2 [Curculionoidea sp. 11 KM-2017]
MKFNKILFWNFLILGTLISISSSSWFMMWLGLEINLLSVIPLINMKNNIYSTEALMKYFITQAIASIMLLYSILMFFNLNNFFNYKETLNLILFSSLMMKMGAAPFHFWFPQIIEGLTWNMTLLMLTWQKIAPMILLSYNINMNLFILSIIILSSSMGSIMGLNQISLRKILTFSSINHLSWMITSLLKSLSLWMLYFSIYSLITINIIFILKFFNIIYLKQLIMKMSSNKHLKLFFMLNFLSLGGLPPFIGFFPKWLTINYLNLNNFWMISLILIMFSLITLIFYSRMILSTLIINNTEQLKMNFPFMKKFILKMNFINLISLTFITFLFNLN